MLYSACRLLLSSTLDAMAALCRCRVCMGVAPNTYEDYLLYVVSSVGLIVCPCLLLITSPSVRASCRCGKFVSLLYVFVFLL